MKSKYLLVVILILAAFLRFYQIDSNPPSLTWDEVAWGYNAYSLGLDGKDEFGRFLPYDYLESFGDFKPPMYAYLDIIPIKLWGLTEFAVRFPSAFFGTITILFTYLLVKQLFRKNNEILALITASLLAISPWHMMLSRAAFEANVATFFLVTGVWLFLKGVQERPFFFVISVIPFVASVYTFNTARIVAPLLIILLTLGFWKTLLKHKKEVLISIILGLFLVLPTTPFLFSDQAKLRFKEVNIFSDIEVIERANQEMTNDNNALLSTLIHNRRFAYGVEFVKHYFDNLSFNFLFIKGDANPKFSIQDVGQMYLWELPFFLIGILFLFRRREGNWWIIPCWLLLAILPAATARETPHALRIETTLPMFQILVAYGLVSVIFLFKSYKKAVIGLVSVIAFVNVVYFLHGYFVHYPNDFSEEWQYGYKDSINYVSQVNNDYDNIFITTQLGRPYIYYLFYLSMTPDDFRKTATVKRDGFGFVTVAKIGKYTFTDEIKPEKDTKSLYIISGEVPQNATIVKEFKSLSGRIILKAYTL